MKDIILLSPASISTTKQVFLYSCEQISYSHERHHLSELDYVQLSSGVAQ